MWLRLLKTIKLGGLGLVFKKIINRLKATLKKTIDLNEGNTPHDLIDKNKPQVFIFATVPYFDVGGGQRSAQLAKVFSKNGYNVYYMYAQPSSEGYVYEIPIPTVKHCHISNITPSDLEGYAKAGDIVIVEAPYKKLPKYIRPLLSKGLRLVYESIDNWETSLGGGLFSRQSLNFMLRHADVITATSLPLVDQMNEFLNTITIDKPVLYLPNAVDDTIFNPNKEYEKPDDISTSNRSLLYYGSLWGEWFDWNVIESISVQHPDTNIYLIGDNAHLQDKIDKMADNVIFLGAKKQADLPAYLVHTDIAILPFKVDRIGKYVSPLKIFEYISMNKLIISTPLPEVINYPNTLVADDVSGWLSILDRDIVKADSRKARNFIKNNNWESRFNNIVRAVNNIQ